MQIVHSRAEFVAARARIDESSLAARARIDEHGVAARAGLDDRVGGEGTVGVVLTMGALHDGHRALIETAAKAADAVVVTVFVNPLQFGPNEDLAKYPRTADADARLCREAGADLLWMPAVEDIYAAGPAQVTLQPGPLAEILEGAVRPGHFGGMLTVVCKFFQLTRPDVTFFGEKDYQQLALVRRMVADLDLPVDVRAIPTEREDDGLARSSRNRYLDPEQRRTAGTIPRALAAGVAAGADGPDAVREATEQLLRAQGIAIDYVAVHGADLGPAPQDGEGRLLIAVRVGTTRLIDNVAVWLGEAGRPG